MANQPSRGKSPGVVRQCMSTPNRWRGIQKRSSRPRMSRPSGRGSVVEVDETSFQRRHDHGDLAVRRPRRTAIA